MMPICNICKGHSKRFGSKDSYDLFECVTCGFTFVFPVPSNLAELYPGGYFDKEEGGTDFGYTQYDADKDPMRTIFGWYLKRFEKLVPGRRILDVGCATGYFLDRARERDWETFGVDISEYAVKETKSRGHNAYLGELPKLDLKQSFSVITLWDVLEHVDDPVAYLKKSYELLATGGILAINTVDVGSFWARLWKTRWPLMVPPEHIQYFTIPSINRALADTGFEVLDIAKPSKKFSLPYIFTILSHWWKSDFLAGVAKRFDNMRWRRLKIPLNFRDNMFIIARKRLEADD